MKHHQQTDMKSYQVYIAQKQASSVGMSMKHTDKQTQFMNQCNLF